MNILKKEPDGLTIYNPIAKDKSNMNIIANQNNYYEEDYLYNNFLSICESRNEEVLNEKYNIIKYIIKKDTLKSVIKKKRIDKDIVYKQIFEKIIYCIENEVQYKDIIDNIIDDGYNSIIYSIVAIALVFQKYIENTNTILINNIHNIYCELSSTTLNIKYSNKIKNRKELRDTEEVARNLQSDLKKITYINNFHSIYNFNDVQINNFNLDDISFINEEIKYRVTTGIIPNLIKPLYGNKPECGARELIQNATDACKERLIREQYKARIDINFDDDFIIIRDNGIGMNIDIIRNNYFCVGNSSKKKYGNLVGQFGIGSLASFLLGHKVLVKTRRYGEDNILRFDYKLEQDENNDSIIDIFIEKDNNFDFGTEIKILLNNNLKNDKKSLLYKLKLKEWYLTSEIQIYINGHKNESIDDTGLEWINFKSEDDNFKAEFLYSSSESQSKLNLDKKIIYNGIPLSENYDLTDEGVYPVSISKSPCINIIDIGLKKKIEINLERSKLTNFEYLKWDLKKAIYKKELQELKGKSPELIDKSNLIMKYVYNGQFIKNIPIIYSRMGAALYSIYTKCILYRNDIKKIFILYNCSNISFEDLNQDYAYIFSNQVVTKKFIGQRLLNSDVKSMCVYNYFMENYFFSADSWSNGLKTEALVSIYNNYGYNIQGNSNLSKSQVWDEHNRVKLTMRNNIMRNSQYGFCKIKGQEMLDLELVRKIFSNNKQAYIECRDVVKSNIVSLEDSFDNYYNSIFNSSLFVWKWK
ncbi:Histidine kinase-, DNA gyrase B-, and HSP90-like ATPase [Clostridium cavendishii DSM 21758]|uniref:Histidine kinase-, DNA gyrase B-, and HSP90-like ATPase n=1 Tax=Clostridium cavendishii DSM 21758 TaxID=1121302 RepID=A0A1M6LUR9_9CLOT|nr:ATP-binding protein [Clostridium cavendishii]SHJ74852.1 Histidine kinase-, DNA gyrase B-, and HSP90-like ATPase [Clostridium cavendishii DSM 21758]